MSINTPKVSNMTTATIKMSHKRRLIDTLRKLFITLSLRILFLVINDRQHPTTIS
ncbi:hypothetical protein D3C78_1889460 [compost metagenome]